MTVGDLLDRADAERSAGRGDAAARLYDEVIERCRGVDDLPDWTRAVLGAASVYLFGAEPGRLPAQLYDVLVRTTEDHDRARVAAALARCWAYAGHADRAVRFADEALERAERCATPELVVDGLDAALAARWGPDELDARVHLTARMDEVAAHVLDSGTRLQAHLWSLQTACETMNPAAMHRHVRALERLGERSARARFFAASRRLMLDLLSGRTDTAAELIATAAVSSEHAGLADGWMVVEAMKGYTAAHAGDTTTAATVAAGCETFGTAEGSPVVCAEAAYLWIHAGRHDRARDLLHAFSGSVLDDLPRDVNWLLTLQCVLEVALAVEHGELVETAARLLTPYPGRAVINAGAVMFHGLTDDTLSRAAAALGDEDTARRRRAAALTGYERLGATWWHARLAARPSAATQTAATVDRPTEMHPTTPGVWSIGAEGGAVPVRALRGFDYLRALLLRPGEEIPAVDLLTDRTGTAIQPALGDILDRQALAAYRRRLTDIDREIDEADTWSDLGRIETLRTERDALIDEIAAATGLAGAPRTVGSTHERARVAATKAIHTAIQRITALDPPTGQHLQRTIRTGRYCSYTPRADDHRRWILG